MNSIILKPKASKVLNRRHPWIFSGAIAEVLGTPVSGETVRVISADGTCCGYGAYSPRSQIRVRIWSFDPAAEVSASFFRERLKQAADARKFPIRKTDQEAWRIVNAEADGLPGLVADRYGRFLICQFLSAGTEYWKDVIVAQLRELFPCDGIYERSDVNVRKKEGLNLKVGTLSGKEPPELLEIKEGKLRFLADVKNGHKTGFYLDQRDNRVLTAEYAEGAEVLNCFSYSGGFAVAAMRAGAANAVNIDSSAAALGLARRNAELNGLDANRMENLAGNVFSELRRFRESGRQFDLIVLDPPKFADSRARIKAAARGYKDINMEAFKILRPGGALFTFSCSGLMGVDLFQKIVSDAALDAKREARILRRLSQAPDHPAALNFPEGHYLKGLVCRVS